MTMLASMQTTRPDDATGDDVKNSETIARAHSFLCALLAFLGFRVLPVETVVDMLGTLETWLVDAKKVRDDRKGVTSKLWWDAFKEAWKVKDTIGAGVAADSAIAEFGKRFVPIVSEDENDRDTLDTGDLDAMRAELDAADRYRSEICNALDGIEGNRAFVHGKVIDELRAERDALLKANAHHANEIETLRKGQDSWQTEAKMGYAVFRQIRDQSGIVFEGWNAYQWEELPKRVALIVAERDALKAQLAGAIVPLPKPDRVEVGQKWAIVMKTDYDFKYGSTMVKFIDGDGSPYFANQSDLDASYYLGTETA